MTDYVCVCADQDNVYPFNLYGDIAIQPTAIKESDMPAFMKKEGHFARDGKIANDKEYVYIPFVIGAVKPEETEEIAQNRQDIHDKYFKNNQENLA